MSERPKHGTGVNFPGTIAHAGQYGNFPGSLALEFGSAKAMNAYFSKPENDDLLVINIIPFQNVFGFKGFLVIATKTLTPEDRQYMDEYQNEMEAMLSKRREERAERAAAAEKSQDEAERTQARLAEVGKKCQEHHGPLVEQNRKVKRLLKRVDPKLVEQMDKLALPEGEDE